MLLSIDINTNTLYLYYALISIGTLSKLSDIVFGTKTKVIKQLNKLLLETTLVKVKEFRFSN